MMLSQLCKARILTGPITQSWKHLFFEVKQPSYTFLKSKSSHYTSIGLRQRNHNLHLNRYFSSSVFRTDKSKENIDVISSDLMKVYLFEKIRFIRALGRFTKYSTLACLLGAPMCFLFGSLNMMSFQAMGSVISVLVFYSTLFTVQSFLFTSRILAKVMVSEDESVIKLSHLTLFGNRKDLYVKPLDIIPVRSDITNAKYVIIKLRNSKKLILFPEMGDIDTNFEALEYILTGGLNQNGTKSD